MSKKIIRGGTIVTAVDTVLADVLIDLALPRDVDPAVAGLQNVFLYNLDDLAKIAEENRAARAAEIAKCQELITARADALWRSVEPRLAAAAGGNHVADRRAESA